MPRNSVLFISARILFPVFGTVSDADAVDVGIAVTAGDVTNVGCVCIVANLVLGRVDIMIFSGVASSLRGRTATSKVLLVE